MREVSLTRSFLSRRAILQGTEVREFHGRSAIGCLSNGTGVALVKSPGGDLGTRLIVLARGMMNLQP